MFNAIVTTLGMTVGEVAKKSIGPICYAAGGALVLFTGQKVRDYRASNKTTDHSKKNN